LRSTLKRLQRSEDLAPDDPALTELKGSILSNITELEVAKTPNRLATPTKILWIAPKPSADQAQPLPSPSPDHCQAPPGDLQAAPPGPDFSKPKARKEVRPRRKPK
jgi:hypothetical protein